MPKSFMVKNSKRWNPPRSSRDIEIPAAVNLGKFSSEYIYLFFKKKVRLSYLMLCCLRQHYT